jgi:homoserine O-succinyltransferase/O-acetyltransferase
MPVLLDTTLSAPAADGQGANWLTIGLVNNMPDAACEATERQFFDLVRAAAPDVVVRLKLFSIPKVPRADYMRKALGGRYRDISQLWDTPLDGLIVTGTEPRAVKLDDEPYWPTMTMLVDWARENTVSTVWSCLAAHAAVLHADGIERRPLPDKLFGVFDCETLATQALTAGVTRLRMPHSRYNDLAEGPLAACGYHLLGRSAAAGVDVFTREEAGSSLFLFFQGHPEYDAISLAREFRRDVGRFLRGEQAHYPAIPQGYFNNDAARVASAFHARALADRRAELMADFPITAIEGGLENSWRHSAVALYRNWVNYLRDHKVDHRSRTPVRRSRRGAWRRHGVPAPADVPVAG